MERINVRVRKKGLNWKRIAGVIGIGLIGSLGFNFMAHGSMMDLRDDNIDAFALNQEQGHYIKELKAVIKSQNEDIAILSDEKWHLEEQLDLAKIEIERLSTIRAKLTAYSPYDNQSGIEGGEITSTGLKPCRKYCAVDPEKIPYGTLLNIPNYGIVEAQDTGSALKKYDGIQVDLYFDTYPETVNFGVQHQDIKIVRWGK